MQYLNVSKDVFVEYNEDSQKALVVNLKDLQSQVDTAKEKLNSIPKGPTDEELLAWAKENYPQMDYSKEKETLEMFISQAEETIKTCQSL